MPWTKGDIPGCPGILIADKSQRVLSYKDAIRESFVTVLDRDTNVVIIGEGVDDNSGVFGTTLGLVNTYGRQRIIDTPIAENALTGIALGMATKGMRPILIHMRMDFLLMAMDQMVNHLAKWHYMFDGKVKVPVVVRCLIGRGWGSGPQHSQSLQALFAHCPGLKVVMPTTPYDVKGMMIAAVEDNNPVLFIEHRWLYEHKSNVPEGRYTVPLDKGWVLRQGTEVTVAAFSYMVVESLCAAAGLEKENISAEILDLRSVNPLDEASIIESVKKTGRLLVADTGWKNCGIGAEIIARVAEKAMPYLKSPPIRIGLPDVPTPSAAVLEKAYYPGSPEIMAAARKLMNR